MDRRVPEAYLVPMKTEATGTKGDGIEAVIETNPAGGYTIRYRDPESGEFLPTIHAEKSTTSTDKGGIR